MTTDLVTWLRQQLDEDAREARELPKFPAPIPAALVPLIRRLDAQCDRVLRDVDAKRRILEVHHDDGHGDCAGCGLDPIGLAMHQLDECPTLLALALPYADREGYDESWRP